MSISKISNPGSQRLHSEEDEHDFSKAQGTSESPKPIETASLSFLAVIRYVATAREITL